MIPIFSGMSFPATMATTPGCRSAALVSMERMRACACVERRSRPYSIRGSAMSSAYLAVPVRCAHEFTFGSRLPTTENSDMLRRLGDGFVDRGVAGAAAEVPRDRLLHVLERRLHVRVEER